MKTPLIYLSLLSVSCAFCTLTYTPNSHAKNIQPTTHIGTWQNKDEDGDGVTDEQDDYPFDASKTQYPVYFEKEPNDNPSVATAVSLVKVLKLRALFHQEQTKVIYMVLTLMMELWSLLYLKVQLNDLTRKFMFQTQKAE
ncbi:hypothetical protein [Pseudoalteromonas sp. 1CM17D]|uniref:hypothetical protein n=1 Tax=Pseudoalteromonas sp. 1CM17D TaxID=2929162 RepID=UPI0020BEC5A2|nr:hypothetical protein [Pseudoalteromonas sp. 1CM17D]MCK8094200.1 hypothetical protein [Pseudoalteromonas sp. 1CM17D]